MQGGAKTSVVLPETGRGRGEAESWRAARRRQDTCALRENDMIFLMPGIPKITGSAREVRLISST